MNALAPFLETANRIWREYRNVGPGNVNADHADELNERSTALFESGELSAEQTKAAEVVRELLLRCINRSEGLNFVTGEAGLIPRRDLIEQLETSLETLGRAGQ